MNSEKYMYMDGTDSFMLRYNTICIYYKTNILKLFQVNWRGYYKEYALDLNW